MKDYFRIRNNMSKDLALFTPTLRAGRVVRKILSARINHIFTCHKLVSVICSIRWCMKKSCMPASLLAGVTSKIDVDSMRIVGSSDAVFSDAVRVLRICKDRHPSVCTDMFYSSHQPTKLEDQDRSVSSFAFALSLPSSFFGSVPLTSQLRMIYLVLRVLAFQVALLAPSKELRHIRIRFLLRYDSSQLKEQHESLCAGAAQKCLHSISCSCNDGMQPTQDRNESQCTEGDLSRE